MSNIIEIKNGTFIINGGNPLPGAPRDWGQAKIWVDKANDNKDEEGPQWSWDCGFKLDYDGDIVKVSSRFYPPSTHGGATWDGNVSIYIGEKEISKMPFDCKTFDELVVEVEKYVSEIRNKIIERLKDL